MFEPAFSSAEIRGLFTDLPARIRRLLPGLLAIAPAVGLLAYFVNLWHGLTPPMFQTTLNNAGALQPALQSGNPAAPAFILSLLGIYGFFFLPLLMRPAMHLILGRTGLVAIGVLIALLAAVIPATTFDQAAGRWTALWSVAGKLPTIGGHTSVLILVLAPIGAIVLLGLLQGLSQRDRWVYLTAIAGFTAAQSVNHECWQRYIEPLLLMLLALAAPRLDQRFPARTPGEQRIRVLGPLALAGLLALVTIVSFR